MRQCISRSNARLLGRLQITLSETDRAALSERVLFIDGEAIVIDKPAGLPVDTPKAGGDSVASLAEELRFGFHRTPVAVHRLDRDTSGCLLLARNPKALRRFAHAFESGDVEKVYLAVVEADIEGEGEIDLPLAKTSSREQGWRMIAGDGGKPALTRWRALVSRGGETLVEFRPATGRTHQIRAHARYGLNAAVVGDPVYGRGASAMLLHASRLIVPRDKKAAIDVSAPLPQRFGEWGDGF